MDSQVPHLKLNHTNIEGERLPEVILPFDHLDRKNTWMEQAVLVPWIAPHRLFGWVHPEAKPGREPFVLHGAFIYVGNIGMQRVGESQVRAVEGPKILLPYDLMTQVDVDIYECSSLIWMKRQGAEMREVFVDLVKRIVMPPAVEVVAPNELPLDPLHMRNIDRQ